MQHRVGTASPKHNLRSTSASSAHTFAAVACQCVVNLLPPRGAGIKRCPCKLPAVPAEWNRRPLTLIYCPANCLAVLIPHALFQTVMQWSVAVAPLCCAASSSLVQSLSVSLSQSLSLFASRLSPLSRAARLLSLSLSCFSPTLSRSLLSLSLSLLSLSPLSLVRSFSILVSLSHTLRRFCSVAPCSDWFVVIGLTLSSPESGVALFLLFSCRSLHPAFQSRLHLSVPAETLRVIFKHYVGVACFHSYLMPCSVMKVDRGLLGKGHRKSVALFQT